MAKKELLKDELRVFVVPVDILDVPDLTVYEKMSYMVLRSFANPREAIAFPSYATIARLGSMSRSSAIRAIQGLLEKGLLRKEARYDVTKDRKIRNTSNLYHIERPFVEPEVQVVSDRHQGSVSVTPPLVSDRHHPGVTGTPEHNHLTDPSRTYPLNNNRAVTAESSADETPRTVVVDHPDEVQMLLKEHGIEVHPSLLAKWRKHGKDKLLQVVREVLSRPDVRNVPGYITKTLQAYTLPAVARQSEPVIETLTVASDSKYAAFYAKMPPALHRG